MGRSCHIIDVRPSSRFGEVLWHFSSESFNEYNFYNPSLKKRSKPRASEPTSQYNLFRTSFLSTSLSLVKRIAREKNRSQPFRQTVGMKVMGRTREHLQPLIDRQPQHDEMDFQESIEIPLIQLMFLPSNITNPYECLRASVYDRCAAFCWNFEATQGIFRAWLVSKILHNLLTFIRHPDRAPIVPSPFRRRGRAKYFNITQAFWETITAVKENAGSYADVVTSHPERTLETKATSDCGGLTQKRGWKFKQLRDPELQALKRQGLHAGCNGKWQNGSIWGDSSLKIVGVTPLEFMADFGVGVSTARARERKTTFMAAIS